MSVPADSLSFRVRNRTSTMESRKSVFGSLKHTLSRKSSSSSEQRPHAKSTSAPPTRRPAGPSNLPRKPPAFDAPPAYTLTPDGPSQLGSNAAFHADNAYAFLDKFDTVFLIDDSGSMAGARWRQTADALMTVTPVCTAHDADGIDILFLNAAEQPSHKNVNSACAVQRIFNTVRPSGATFTGMRLHDILTEYLRTYERAPKTTKPINIICITDGAPSDEVESPIIKAAQKLDRLDAPAWQVGIQFFQVGNDVEATKHLRQLDDELAEISGDANLRDMVDTVPYTDTDGAKLTGDGILKVVLGAVTRRLDRKSRELHR